MYSQLRKLAKSLKWQTIYRKSKDMAGINIFRNHYDFSDAQINFLQWLEIYHVLEKDLALKRPFISEAVLEDDIRTDAYLIIRPEILDKENNPKDTKGKKGKQDRVPHPTVPSVVFKKG